LEPLFGDPKALNFMATFQGQLPCHILEVLDFGFVEGTEVKELYEHFLFTLLHDGLRVKPLGGGP